jgi:hypothetical protein
MGTDFPNLTRISSGLGFVIFGINVKMNYFKNLDKAPPGHSGKNGRDLAVAAFGNLDSAVCRYSLHLRLTP